MIDECKHFLQILRKIYYKIQKYTNSQMRYLRDDRITGCRTRYLRDDGTTGYGFIPTGTDHEAERHWRSLWADRLDPAGEFHNAGTNRWPDKQEERSKR